MVAQIAGQPKFAIFPEAIDKFFLKVVDAQMSFTRDDKNSVTGIILHQQGQNLTGQKIE